MESTESNVRKGKDKKKYLKTKVENVKKDHYFYSFPYFHFLEFTDILKLYRRDLVHLK